MDTPTPITTADSAAEGRLKVDAAANTTKRRKVLLAAVKDCKKK